MVSEGSQTQRATYSMISCVFKCLEYTHTLRMKADKWGLGARGRGIQDWLIIDIGIFLFQGDKNVLHLYCGYGCTTLNIQKRPHWISFF